MPTSTQSLRSILEQAPWAQAAYADLSGISFDNTQGMIAALTTGGEEQAMTAAHADYIANVFDGRRL